MSTANAHVIKCLQIDSSKVLTYEESTASTSTLTSATSATSVTTATSAISSNNVNTFLIGAAKKLKTGRKFTGSAKLPGLHIFENFLTCKEENDLVHKIEQSQPRWKMSHWNGKHWNKEWGTKIRFVGAENVGAIDDESQSAVLPNFLHQAVISKFSNGDYLPTAAFKPNECNAIKYEVAAEGHFLGAHFDDRRLSGEMLANVSMLADATMVYVNPKTNETVEVTLPRRSLQVVTGESRYQWKHSIPLDKFHGDTRVSLTFRRQGSSTAVQVVSGVKRGW
jgi:alkylated DNA repair dioxygenase AlkB